MVDKSNVCICHSTRDGRPQQRPKFSSVPKFLYTKFRYFYSRVTFLSLLIHKSLRSSAPGMPNFTPKRLNPCAYVSYVTYSTTIIYILVILIFMLLKALEVRDEMTLTSFFLVLSIFHVLIFLFF